MKLALASILLASTSAFTFVPKQQHAVSRASTALNASRAAQKAASRRKWSESRGGVAAEEAATAGLMTNDEGLEYVKLVHPETGATSDVYLFGGVVTSYVADGVEVRYCLSPLPFVVPIFELSMMMIRNHQFLYSENDMLKTQIFLVFTNIV